jgi:phosphatidylglycerol:prolipoprotein diacylglycerol transferase
MVCGFYFAFLYALFFLKNYKTKFVTEKELYFILACLFFCAMFGAKAAFLFAERPDIFLQDPLSIFKIWEGGFVYYGGLIGAVCGVYIYLKIRKISVVLFSDMLAVCLAINVFFIRTGCLFAGCCYGKETSLPWGLKFSAGAPLHPTQIYEMAGAFALFLFLHFYNKKNFGRGKTLALFLCGYSLIRFAIEFLRGDERGAYHFGLSVSQNISIAVFAVAAIIFYKADKNARNDNV